MGAKLAVTLFEYLMVLVSIIVGLGIAEILTGVARQYRHRHTSPGYWVHSCGVALIFGSTVTARCEQFGG